MNSRGSDRFKSAGGALVLLAIIVAVGATVATVLVARPRVTQDLHLS